MRRFILPIGLALIAPSALAQQAPASEASPWERSPTYEEFLAAYPRASMGDPRGGSAALSCTVTRSSGVPTGCSVISETPSGAGFGSAALTLTNRYALAAGLRPAGDEAAPVEFNVEFPVLQPSVILMPSWERVPTGEDLNKAFPVRALRLERNGRAVIACTVDAMGGLADCSIAEESPEGFGFGAAALSLSGKFRMRANPTITGLKGGVGGAKISVPIAFNLN